MKNSKIVRHLHFAIAMIISLQALPNVSGVTLQNTGLIPDYEPIASLDIHPVGGVLLTYQSKDASTLTHDLDTKLGMG